MADWASWSIDELMKRSRLRPVRAVLGACATYVRTFGCIEDCLLQWGSTLYGIWGSFQMV